ncbi:22729_t:CDS:2 [Gigaspora margarita]|uniref:D-arabinono-1,4-lactone oxidase n=1 Tax=Gigaspora margarita TaxID=4874 RepID=A0ABN7UCG7_GIGMA|nr:22729_t:CDS:2 [Gigaspora margarita]
MVMRYILSFLLILSTSIIYKYFEINNHKGLVIRSTIQIKNKTWVNYNGVIRISPDAIFEPSTLEDLIDIVKLARINNKTIRCAAQGHTVSSLSVTKHYLVVVTKLNKITVQKHFKYGWTVTAEAGTPFEDIDNALRNHDPPLTLDSEAIFGIFRVSGVVAVGAHGVKTTSGIVSDQLCSMKIVTGSGEIREFMTFRAQPMYNLRLTDIYVPVKWLNNPQNIKNLLESSDGIQVYYWPFNGFNQSDSNLRDFNKDRIVVKNWIRTNEPVSFTQQQLEQLHEVERQKIIKEYTLISSNLQNPEAVSNIAATVLSENVDTSFVYQAPDAIHYCVHEGSAKYDLMEIGFKVNTDFSNVAAEFTHAIQTLYEFAKKGKFPLNHLIDFRIIKSSKALLSPTFNNDPETLYCQVDFMAVTGTPGYEEYTALLAQRYFDKYKAKPYWGKRWEFIPNVTYYLSDVLSDEINQFEKVREKYDSDKIFFDNESLQNIFNGVLC